MTAGNERFWSYARPKPPVTMPWTQRTNWSRSPFSPSAGSRAIRTSAAITRPAARTAQWAGVQRRDGESTAVIGRSDSFGRPVALGEAVDTPELGHLAPEGADGIGHLA